MNETIERQMSLARLKGDYVLYWCLANDLGQAEHMNMALSFGQPYEGFMTAMSFIHLRFGDQQLLAPSLLALRAERKEQM